MSRLAAWYDARRGPRTIIIVWLATRVLILVMLAAFERFVTGDVFYYYRKINSLFSAGVDRTLYEYPTPVDPVAALRRILAAAADISSPSSFSCWR